MSGWKTAGLCLALPAAAAVLHLYGLVCSAGDRWPGQGIPGTLSGKISALENEVTRLKGGVDRLPAARSRLRAFVDVADEVAGILPSAETPDELLGLIRGQAEDFGVEVRKINVVTVPYHTETKSFGSRGNGGVQWGAWRFSLFVNGDYNQLAGFINCLEQLDQPDALGENEPVFLDITDFSIAASDVSPSSERDRKKGHSCTLILYAYLPLGEGDYTPGE